MKHKVVYLEWVDSLADNGKWIWKRNINFTEFKTRMRHISVGIIVEENKDYIAITPGVQDFVYENEDGDYSLLAPLFIPKVAITKRKILKI